MAQQRHWQNRHKSREFHAGSYKCEKHTIQKNRHCFFKITFWNQNRLIEIKFCLLSTNSCNIGQKHNNNNTMIITIEFILEKLWFYMIGNNYQFWSTRTHNSESTLIRCQTYWLYVTIFMSTIKSYRLRFTNHSNS